MLHLHAMHVPAGGLLLGVIAFLAGWCPASIQTQPISLEELRSIWSGPKRAFRAKAALAVAEKLHGRGRDETISAIGGLGKLREDKTTAIVLCRLVFEKKEGSPPFAGNQEGLEEYVGKIPPEDWPDSPISIIDGTPIYVRKMLLYSGPNDPKFPEKCSKWFSETWAWRKTPVQARTGDERRRAVRKLIDSTKWREPLSEWDLRFLRDQAE